MRKFSNINKCLLSLILLIGCWPLMAQQEEPQDLQQSQLANKDETTPSGLPDQQTDKPADEDQAKQKKSEEENKRSQQARKRSREVFKPSEEISEDLPAPFPVDI